MLEIKNISNIFRNRIVLGDFEILLSKIIGKDKVFLHTHPEYKLNLLEILKLIYFIVEYMRGYSVAAIIEKKGFYNLNFFVNKHVLIPRPETELMVDEVLSEVHSSTKKILLIDVGTGSGCIPISILKNTDKIHHTIALDISNPALKVAKNNIQTHDVNIELLKSFLLSKISHQDTNTYNEIIITANLPYLTTDQVKQESSIQKEPTIALIAKENGLALYRQLLKQIVQKFVNKKLLILFEIDPTQTAQIIMLAKNYLPQAKLEIKKDLAGLDRILKIST